MAKKKNKLDKQTAKLIYEFIIALDLVPQNLITKEVLDLIHKSWQREDVLNVSESQKIATHEYLNRLRIRSRRRLSKKILDDMQPVNFSTLFDNL